MNNILDFDAGLQTEKSADGAPFAQKIADPLGTISESAGTDTIPANIATDQVLKFDTTVSGYFNSTSDHDWIRVHLEAGVTYTIALTQPSSPNSSSAQLDLVTGSGQVLTTATYNSTPGAGAASGAVVTYTATSTGNYYLSASSGDGVNAAYSVAFRDTIANVTPSSTTLAAGAHQLGVLENRSDSDVYAVSLTAGVTYDFVMSGHGADGVINPSLTLVSAAGGSTLSNDNVDAVNGFYDAVIHYTATATGTYYLSAQSSSLAYTTERSGVYDVHFGVSSDVYTATTATTGHLAEGQSASSTIDTIGDQDWFAVTLQAGYIYNFDLSGSGGTALSDPYLQLLNGSGNWVADDDDGGTNHNSHLSFYAQAGGTYYLSAQSFNNGTPDTETGGYTLSVGQKVTPTVDTVGQSLWTAGQLTLGAPVDSQIDTPNDTDWYAVDLVGGTGYDFDLKGSNGFNPTLYLYDSSNNLIAENDDFGQGTDAHLDFEPETSGRYYLSAAGTNGSNYGGYSLGAAVGDRPLLTQSIDWGTQLNPAGGVVKVYFAAAGETYASETSLGWNAYEIQQALAALDVYSQYINLTFVQTSDASQADFKLVTADDLGDGVLAYMNPPGTADAGVGVFARNSVGWSTASGGLLEKGGIGFETLLHEFGHGLGLAHPFDGGGSAPVMTGVLPNYYEGGDYQAYGYQNQAVYTIMSYNNGWPAGPVTHSDSYLYGYEKTPMAIDVAALQAKYGANMSTGSGDTTYTLAVPTVGSFNSLWDAGGTDLLSAQIIPTSFAVNLDLRPASMYYTGATSGGVVSYIVGLGWGMTIDQGVTIENATGHDGIDTIMGNDAANIIQGLGGDDSLIGGSGNDTLYGGTGMDRLDGGTGTNLLYGGSGDDIYTVNSASDVVSETSVNGIDDGGNDLIISQVAVFTLPGFIERLALWGISAHTGIGNSLDNTITGSLSSDSLSGGAGNDWLIGGSLGDTLDGGDGADWADYSTSFIGVHASLQSPGTNTWEAAGDVYISIENLSGSGSWDVLEGDAGNNVINGLFGSDSLNGGAGNDTLDGGDGEDQIYGQDGIDLIRGSTGNDLAGGGYGDDSLYGDDGNDTLFGELGNDQLTGGNGDDALLGQDGNDRLLGQGGFDSLYGGIGDDSLFGDDGNDQLFGEDGLDQLHGGAGNDQLVGGVGGDSLYGEDNNDTLFGEADNDLLIGGIGDDQLFGQDGNDTAFGEAGNDILVAGTGNDLLYGQVGADTLRGEDGNDSLFGGADNDQLVGGFGDDAVYGEDGNDTLFGEFDNDLLIGGAGNDVQYGQDGTDVLFGEAGDDQLTGGNGDDRLYGQDGNDLLQGEAGTDLLDGGIGGDFLVGGAGQDQLTGGAGSDVFYYDTPLEPADFVTDFSHAEGDRLVFQGSAFNIPVGFTLTAGVGLLQGAGVHPAAATATFYYDTTSKALWFDADGTGAGEAHVIAFLTNTPTLHTEDFLFV